MGDPEKVDAADAVADVEAKQKARREAQAEANKQKVTRGYEYAFSQQAERSKHKSAEFAVLEDFARQHHKKQKSKDEGAKADDEKPNFAPTKPKILLTKSPWTHPNFVATVQRTLLHLKDEGIYQRGNVLVRLIEEWANGVWGERVKVWRGDRFQE
jgi:hypothetical protein